MPTTAQEITAHTSSDDGGDRSSEGSSQSPAYSAMFRRIVLLTVACSVVPLLLIGWGISIFFTRLATSRRTEAFVEVAEQHKQTIDLFLTERTSAINLVAQTHTLEELCDRTTLRDILTVLNREYNNSFTDFGVINDAGDHLAYVGPYALSGKNYRGAFWFDEVRERGVYISDVFLGFREVPHFIVAVRRSESGRVWMLRATINTEVFHSLVESATLGATGEVFLLNRKGTYQTRPRLGGEVMGEASVGVTSPHGGTKFKILETDVGSRQALALAWLKSVPWLLVVKQDQSEAFRSVSQARYVTLGVVHVAAIMILLVSLLSARHTIRMIRERDAAADQLNRQLMQTSKLAAIGELAAGVAHEVNNPLAIILTERQILLDRLERVPRLDDDFVTRLRKSLVQIGTQCNRCKHTTQNLLRFARRTESRMEQMDLNAFLGEAVELFAREASSMGIEFVTDFDEDLPSIVSDPSQLQQVVLNLLKNAVDSHDSKPYGRITISTRASSSGKGVEVVVADTGCGIRPEHLPKIWDPFFTTKSIGKGTGLGLSTCFGIVKLLGGEIDVETKEGEGTTFSFKLPLSAPGAELEAEC